MRDFEQDRRICEAATKGPWHAYYGFKNKHVLGGPDYIPVASGKDLKDEDATFIAAAREGWPAALDRIVELENRLKMQDDALERAGSAARFAISQEDAEKLRGIVFADNGDKIEKELEQEANEIESLKRQLQAAAETSEGCPFWKRDGFRKDECPNCGKICEKKVGCWIEYWRQEASK